MTLTQTKVEFLTEASTTPMSRFWLDMTESGHPYAHKCFIRKGRKYLKVMMCDVTSKGEDYTARNGGRVFMFIDKETEFRLQTSWFESKPATKYSFHD